MVPSCENYREMGVLLSAMVSKHPWALIFWAIPVGGIIHLKCYKATGSPLPLQSSGLEASGGLHGEGIWYEVTLFWYLQVNWPVSKFWTPSRRWSKQLMTPRQRGECDLLPEFWRQKSFLKTWIFSSSVKISHGSLIFFTLAHPVFPQLISTENQRRESPLLSPLEPRRWPRNKCTQWFSDHDSSPVSFIQGGTHLLKE